MEQEAAQHTTKKVRWNNVYDYSNAIKLRHIISDNFCNTIKKDFKTKKHDKKKVIRGIFLEFIKLMIEDLIEHNYRFRSPNKEGFSIRIQEKHECGVNQIIASGKTYLDVDLIASDAKIYEFAFFSIHLKYWNRKIRIGHSTYKKLVQKVNQGRRYFERK